MAFDENTLLKLRREFSGKEKYRLFLQQLDRLENELREERKQHTELIKSYTLSSSQIQELQKQIVLLQEQLDEYDRDNVGKTCVSMKTHNRILKRSKKWEDLYIQVYHKLKNLQKQEGGQNG